MSALSHLAKFTGCYKTTWQEIKENYSLKWSHPKEQKLKCIEKMYDNSQNINTMIDYIHDVMSVLPPERANIFVYAILVGLRPKEACISLSLLKDPATRSRYFNQQKMMLEHFHFPEHFIRTTKNAYFSVVTEEILSITKICESISYNTLRLAVRRKNKNMNMQFCRKIMATYLKDKGMDQQDIDLFQGRANFDSVFAKHYNSPDFEAKCKRIRKILTELYQLINPQYDNQ